MQDAAESGDVEAQFQLGLLYYRGKSVKGDGDVALNWLEKAYAGGHIKAPFYIGRLNAAIPSLKTAFECYEIGADLGDPSCVGRIGLCYLRGEGVPQSKEKAFEYFKKAKDMGNIRAGGRYIRMLASGQAGLKGILCTVPEYFRHVRNGVRLGLADQAAGRDHDERYRI